MAGKGEPRGLELLGKAMESRRMSRTLTVAFLQARARVAPLAVRTYATAKPGAFSTLS